MYRLDGNRQQVVDYHHMESEDFLARTATLAGTALCALDTGVVAFRGDGIDGLRRLGSARLGADTTVLGELASGRLGLDLYNEILTACVRGISREVYLERLAWRGGASRPVL